MPRVGKQHFPYTKMGKQAAKKAAKKAARKSKKK